MKNSWQLLAVVVILLLQLFLRTHDILAMPAYADESLHIRRAEVVYDFNTIWSWLPKKVLLYYYIGLFEVPRVDYLLVSRLAVALSTLIGGTGLYALGKRLFNHQSAVMGLFFYAVTPFAVFFDRMALADPLTLALSMVTIWFCLLWIKRPTVKMSIITGVLFSLMLLAKLTAAGFIAAPVVGIWLFEKRERLRERYFKPLLIIGAVLAAVWIPIFIPIVIGQANDEPIVFIDDHLLNIHEKDQNFIENLVDNIQISIEQSAIFLWTPVLILMVVCAAVLLTYHPKQGAFLGVMFILAWTPAILFGAQPSSRYLEIGVPFLALILTGGLYTLTQRISENERRLTIQRAVVAGIMVYGLAWGGHFFYQAITEPENLNLPELDLWRYVQSTTSGFGQRDSIEYLQTTAQRSESTGKVEVYGILGSCHSLRLYFPEPGDIHLTCAEYSFIDHQMSPETLADMMNQVEKNGWIYILLEPSLDTNYDELPLEWELEKRFTRPHNGRELELWRVSRDILVLGE